MLNFHKNELINATLVEFYKTFEHTLDTVDYVPEKYNDKIQKILLGFSTLEEIELFCLTDFLCFLMTYADEWFGLTVQ